MLFEIKHRWTGTILFSVETSSLRLTLEAAIQTDADLTGANLRGANLTDANLTDANLTDANLTDANLTDANLTDANLTDADLTDADLTDADLTGANLTDADLTGANLTGANLTGANLTDADLTGANLTDANLTSIRDDFWAVLSGAPAEVPGLRQALIEGRIDGSTYHGPCACLVGTLAQVRGVAHDAMPLIHPNSARPIERWFMNIRPGDTPDNSPIAHQTLTWLNTWLDAMRAAFATPEDVSHV